MYEKRSDLDWCFFWVDIVERPYEYRYDQERQMSGWSEGACILSFQR